MSQITLNKNGEVDPFITLLARAVCLAARLLLRQHALVLQPTISWTSCGTLFLGQLLAGNDRQQYLWSGSSSVTAKNLS